MATLVVPESKLIWILCMANETSLFKVNSELFGSENWGQRSDKVDDHQTHTEPHVAILMCTYNGERFLPVQLASIEHQTHRHWSLHISDDNSQDLTLDLLLNARDRMGDARIKITQGPRKGFVANFLSLTCSKEINADYFAWCDQDDIWCEDKLEVAIKWLETVPQDLPALYCGRTEMICESGRHAGHSPLFTRPPSFVNSLVQSIAGGNTMVFNQAARSLLQEAGTNAIVPSHDWWAYQLISGCGGLVFYDPVPTILYRQHGDNLVGSNSTWAARLVRIRMVFAGRFSDWNEQTINALDSMRHRMDKEHISALEHFKAARKQSLPFRVLSCARAGIYRQTFFGNLGLAFAILIRKI
jgi:glycosyltransferase involved in cell wall biosynthesis